MCLFSDVWSMVSCKLYFRIWRPRRHLYILDKSQNTSDNTIEHQAFLRHTTNSFTTLSIKINYKVAAGEVEL